MVTIEWDTTKSSKHAIDYLTTYNRTVANANPCLGVSGCALVHALPDPCRPTGDGWRRHADRRRTSPSSAGRSPVSAPTCYTGARLPTGDKSRQISITFTASVANPVLAWGGHIATRKDWGANNSAVAISGSPYHTRLIDLDGSGGNQDRSLSADAVIFPASITIIKDATPKVDELPVHGLAVPVGELHLVDDGTSANTKVFNNVFGFDSQGNFAFTGTVNETPIPAGWGFDSVSCTVANPFGANGGGDYTTNGTAVTLNVKEGENWVCTYNDSIRNGTLRVIKHVINDNGGTNVAADWSIHVKSGANEVTGSPQPGVESPGTAATRAGGHVHRFGDGCPLGVPFDGFSGDCDTSGSVTLALGQTKTCTLTNNDIAPTLNVIKHVINDNGGTNVAADWSIHVKSACERGHGFAAGGLGVRARLHRRRRARSPPSETGAPSGYAFDGFSGDCNSSGDVTLAIGENKTCTLTNNDVAPTLHVIKHVINDNGGTNVAADWSIHVKSGANEVTGSPQPGVESPGTLYTRAGGHATRLGDGCSVGLRLRRLLR